MSLIDLPQRMQDKIVVDPGSACWWWTAFVDKKGYGHSSLNGKNSRAYVLIYEELVGPVPSGLQLDHLCRNTSCVNPAHLEPVTPRENTLRGVGPTAQNARKTHCVRGHSFDDDVRIRSSDGARICRECHRQYIRARWRRLALRSPEPRDGES